MTPTEILVTQAMAKLLNVESVGPDADFVELGGTSVIAAQLIAALRERTGIELTAMDVYLCQNAGELAAELDKLVAEAGSATEKREAVS